MSVLVPVDLNQTEKEVTASLNELRTIRLELAKAQLNSVEQTVDDMIERGLAKKRQRNRLLREVSAALVDKIVDLEERSLDKDALYFDELLLYLDLMPNKAEEKGIGR